MSQELHGHGRAPLTCGCSGDSGSGYGVRCAEGEALWNTMQAASRAANEVTSRHWDYDVWPAYARAREAYLAHVAAHKPTETTEPRRRHPQREKPRLWRPASERQA